VLQRRSDTEEPVEVGRLGTSDYFGTLSLIYPSIVTNLCT